jgi:hypothetical protein
MVSNILTAPTPRRVVCEWKVGKEATTPLSDNNTNRPPSRNFSLACFFPVISQRIRVHIQSGVLPHDVVSDVSPKAQKCCLRMCSVCDWPNTFSTKLESFDRPSHLQLVLRVPGKNVRSSLHLHVGVPLKHSLLAYRRMPPYQDVSTVGLSLRHSGSIVLGAENVHLDREPSFISLF